MMYQFRFNEFYYLYDKTVSNDEIPDKNRYIYLSRIIFSPDSVKLLKLYSMIPAEWWIYIFPQDICIIRLWEGEAAISNIIF